MEGKSKNIPELISKEHHLATESGAVHLIQNSYQEEQLLSISKRNID